MAERRVRRSIETDLFGKIKYEKTINSKKKGDKNERLVSKWLQEWVGKPFTRVPSSGGLRWQGTANVCGDVVCEDADFNFAFTVETKHLKRIVFDERLRSNSRIFSVLDQCMEDCSRSGKRPMLILRKDGMPTGTYIVYFLLEDTNYIETIIDSVSIGHSKVSGLSVRGYRSEDILKIPFAKVLENL